MGTRLRGWSLATLALAAFAGLGVTACGSGGKGESTTPAECSEHRVAVVFRLDYLTLQPKGFRVLTPEGEALAAEDAAAAALEAFAPLAGGHIAEANEGMLEWEENPFERWSGTPAGSEVYAAFYDPADFGGVVLLDAATGAPLFVGETVWAGEGEILYPGKWNGAEGLEYLASAAGEPAALTVVDRYSEGNCCHGMEDECVAVSCTTGEEAFDAIRKSRLLRDIASCGPYHVSALMYPVTVGMTNWDTAEWVVVVTGTAPAPVLTGRYEPESVLDDCTATLPTPADPPELLAAYKVCPPGTWADDAAFFMGEFGEWAGAYLYSDGTLLFRNPTDGLPWFLYKQLDTEDWCEVLAGMEPGGFQGEAAQDGLAITEAIDAPHSFVLFREQGKALTVRLYGDLWDAGELLPGHVDVAPNAVALAAGLRGFEGVTGKPWGAEQMALWAWANAENGFPEPCPGDSPEWPFPALDLAPFAADHPFLDPPIVTLDAAATKAVREWWLETDGPESGQGACVAQDGALFRVYVLDLPPGGYEAVPMPSCRTTAI
jgi:hypothetical protein